MSKKNIILIGFMGSGKTTYGYQLSQRLGYTFVDTDKQIERQQQMPVSKIFEQEGEPYFRLLEKKMAIVLSNVEKTVVATGGGMIKAEENMENLKKNGIVVYLKATPQQIYENIGQDTNRPLLAGGDRMEKIQTLMEQRRPLYEKYADVTVDVTGKTLLQVIDALQVSLEGKL